MEWNLEQHTTQHTQNTTRDENSEECVSTTTSLQPHSQPSNWNVESVTYTHILVSSSPHQKK